MSWEIVEKILLNLLTKLIKVRISQCNNLDTEIIIENPQTNKMIYK